MTDYILKRDWKIAKTFMACPSPKFITDMGLDMEIDYLAGLCTRFIDKDKCLNHKLSFLDDKEQTAIEDYIKRQGDDDDKIFYLMMKTTQIILHKYYDNNGNWKSK